MSIQSSINVYWVEHSVHDGGTRLVKSQLATRSFTSWFESGFCRPGPESL